MKTFFTKNALKNKIQHYKMSVLRLIKKITTGGRHFKKLDKKTDEASKASFPASDAPAHIS